MNPIGGYFQLELNDNKTVYHDNAVAINSGRNALEYILLTNKSIKKIYLPYYSCDVLLQPIKRLKLDYEFYKINSMLEPEVLGLNKNELILYINYFGIVNHRLCDISKKYNNIIIDNSQAFFSKPIPNTPTIYSPRKFFGLPDGGFAYTKNRLGIKLIKDKSIERFEHLLKRIEDGAEAGFELFKQNDLKLNNLPLSQMSNITERLLKNINFKQVLNKRNENFLFLHKHLKKVNELTPIIKNEKINGPMVYPFLKRENRKLKDKLIKNKIFVATYWPNVYEWVSKKSWEYYLTNNIIPLPIDQRYGIIELKIILSYINN